VYITPEPNPLIPRLLGHASQYKIRATLLIYRTHTVVSDIAIFVLKRDDKLQLTNSWGTHTDPSHSRHHGVPRFIAAFWRRCW